MTFLTDLHRELAARGIRGRLAARIEAELTDHLACDPAANVGTPDEIAERFAVELRVVRTRRASIGGFAALGLTAFALVGLGRYGTGNAAAALVVIACAQVAFVAGSLALLRALRGSSAGDLRLAQRRELVALAAGAGVCVGLAFLSGPLALAPLPFLFAAAWATRGAGALTPAARSNGLTADLGPYAHVVLAALGIAVVGVVCAQGAFFEGSASEGIIRGAIEAAGLCAGVVVLGRPLELRGSHS